MQLILVSYARPFGEQRFFCFKEVLGWLSTVVLCELLLIAPTINRFVINNWISSSNNPTFRPLYQGHHQG